MLRQNLDIQYCTSEKVRNVVATVGYVIIIVGYEITTVVYVMMTFGFGHVNSF